MRRLLGTLALAGALLAVTVHLMDKTQNRPDAHVEGSSTTVEFTVTERGFRRGEDAAASALWAVCAATVSGTVDPMPQSHGDRWQVTIEPALGEHGENRLVGCIEDATLDRVLGDVVSLRHER